MRSTGVIRSHNSPLRIVPQRGKVTEYSVKPPRSEHWRVLHEREPGLYLANDPGHFGPQSAPLSIEAVTLSGDADVLAGEPSADNVDVSAPWLAFEGPDVIPHGEGWEHSVPLSGKHDAPWKGSKLNSADGNVSKLDVCKDSTTSPGEKVHGSKFSFRKCHTI